MGRHLHSTSANWPTLYFINCFIEDIIYYNIGVILQLVLTADLASPTFSQAAARSAKGNSFLNVLYQNIRSSIMK